MSGPHRAILFAVLAAGCIACGGGAPQAPAPPQRPPDARYEPSPVEVVHAMLELAQVRAGDVVYDLGCGDGRIVIAAVRRLGARGVCVDIDPARIAESRENARRQGVADRIHFRQEDLYATDLGGATVVMLYLTVEMNLALRPKLLRELRPGSRIVSHWHSMGDWQPQQTQHVQGDSGWRTIFLWTVPAR